MQNADNISPAQPPDYKALYENLLAAHEQLQVELLQLKKLIFGSTHERYVPQNTAGPRQGILFNAEPVAEVVAETKTLPEREVTKTTIVSKHKGREGFPEKLRRESIVIEPKGIDTRAAQKIGEDVTELLAYSPSELYVKKICRPRYAMSHTGSVIQAPAPARAIEKCSADTSLLTQIAVEKYIDHLPLYRQIKRYERLGVSISDSTMGDWVRQTAHALTGICDRHKELVLASHYLHADETKIKVLTSEKKGATHQGYYWVYQSHHDKLILFDYRPGRGREGPETVLKDFKGYLQTDGYSGYDIFREYPGITQCYCMAHSRRKFHEALGNDKERAGYALEQIQHLYNTERQARARNINPSCSVCPQMLNYFSFFHRLCL